MLSDISLVLNTDLFLCWIGKQAYLKSILSYDD